MDKDEGRSEFQKRQKVKLGPGCSMMDWVNLCNSGKDLTGTGGRIFRIPMEEVKKHNKEDDAWMVLRGKVYDVTEYIRFHPGGKAEIMKGVGKDGTSLFDKKHSWVNAENMLKKVMVGVLVTVAE
eukprot:CAMPEP_0201532174 /NCGR_PEP_ID=MMETSP0161_2-20130828/49663_1 /ASSEMBLY_ACC=CAM_ASM_000251 /TAXON_ID=180227 /ORGANISM="Neoparamoeba aestuarina, Strain SoJaBio B1-5/56/2" /LENGTH=124 /DNA_ID=CAMNT_0047935451 /DNA_START=108 /DNA_END=482 /DNA_ORIENTATION=+